jgi:hypothetical protein
MDAALRYCTRLTDIRKGESDNINKAKQYKKKKKLFFKKLFFSKNIFKIQKQT